jgi:hypothetical protein
VDPKSLDPDAELKRFFGAKVVNSAQQSTGSKEARYAKVFEKHISRMRILFAKPKMTWPITSSFGGLGMSALDENEINDIREVHQHAQEMSGANEKWFTGRYSFSSWVPSEVMVSVDRSLSLSSY